MYLYSSSGSVVASSSLTANGSTVTFSPAVTLGALSITAYRFALVGNELQLDLSLTRSGSFADQVVITAFNGSAYSKPYNVSDGSWSNSASANTCNGTSIASSILAGAGAWQCWQSSQLGTPSADVYGNPYWDGQSGDGNSANIGWLLLGTGYPIQFFNPLPGTLGYFGLAGGGGSPNLYFSNAGSPVTVKLLNLDTTTTPPTYLLDAPATAMSHVFGWYSIDPNHPNAPPTAATMHTLLSYSAAGGYQTTATFQPTPYYGLFLTSVEAPPPNATFFSQPQFNQGCAGCADGLQHFAVFQESASTYYIGVEDQYKSSSDLDYNDVIVQLSNGSTAPTPSSFTTYLAPYGSGSPHLTGNATILALRAYNPSGTAQITQVQTYLDAASTGATEYYMLAENDGTGRYFLFLQNASGTQPA